METLHQFAIEMKFTETYKKYQHEHIALREMMCLQAMFPEILDVIPQNTVFAGLEKKTYIGFDRTFGYYCKLEEIERELSANNYDEPLKAQINQMVDFWKTENTATKTRAAYPKNIAEALPSDNFMYETGVAFPLYRMAGSYLDYEKLLKNGILGMKSILQARKARAVKQGEDLILFEMMEMALDLFTKCCNYYETMALELAASESNPLRKSELQKTAVALERISLQKPQTLREAIQMSWLYSVLCGSINYGRMDVYLGDFLADDLQKGRINMEEAQELINSYWRLIAIYKPSFNGRVIVGGKGRSNEENADRIALLALEASRVVKETEPQLTLRYYKGMNEELMDKALAVIGEGRTYPLLYNDDVNVAAVSKAFNISFEEAMQYVPFGCGEYVIDHSSYGTPNGVINLLKALEIALHDGVDTMTGKQMGLKTSCMANFHDFEDVYNAYKKQVEYFVDALAVQEELTYRISAQTAPFLYLSMLYDDCIDNGKGIFDGGIKYLGGTIETYGNINTADSLLAIKDIVYEKKLITLTQLIEALDYNFEGYPQVRRLLLDAPKYGNDNEIADEMAISVHEHICRYVQEQNNKVKLHSYLVVIINNNTNTTFGKWTAASSDGRLYGEPMANANNPSGGSDKKGLTAMLNSLVKLDPTIHAGAVQNIKLSPELFKENGTLVKSIIKTYFENGGTQAMITVVNRNDLEQAMIEPEKYSYLFVRVGGFSAKFVELYKSIQYEILSRTLY